MRASLVFACLAVIATGIGLILTGSSGVVSLPDLYQQSAESAVALLEGAKGRLRARAFSSLESGAISTTTLSLCQTACASLASLNVRQSSTAPPEPRVSYIAPKAYSYTAPDDAHLDETTSPAISSPRQSASPSRAAPASSTPAPQSSPVDEPLTIRVEKSPFSQPLKRERADSAPSTAPSAFLASKVLSKSGGERPTQSPRPEPSASAPPAAPIARPAPKANTVVPVKHVQRDNFGAVKAPRSTAAAANPDLWDELWAPRTGPVDPEYHAIIQGIMNSVKGTKEYDKGWMLLMQAVMRRRSKEWYTDPSKHGGQYVPDAATLESRLRHAYNIRDCRREDTTVVAAVMARGEGRYIQEWLTWHLYIGYSHIVVFYEDANDGTLNVLQPFIGASLVTAIHTPSVPGVRESMAALESQVYRQRLVYDHTLRQLQRVACRYRGVGSPFAAELAPCTTEELTAYYTKITKASDPPSFVDPASRPTDRKGRAKLGSAWSHSVKHERNKNRRPPPPAKSDAAVTPVNEPVPPVTHTLWLAAPDSDEFMAPEEGLCMSAFLLSISTTHAAFGAPWLHMFPNDVLERHGSILLRDLNRRLAQPDTVTMSKYITNVRYTVAVDVHYPFLLEPFSLLDERRGLIDPEQVGETVQVAVHNFGPNSGRRVWNYHFVTRSLEASVWKGVRQVLDDTGGGNARTTRSMLGVAISGDTGSAKAIRDDSLWRQSRSFMLTVLLGPKRSKGQP